MLQLTRVHYCCYRCYRCSRRRRRGETACQGTGIRDEKLESIVIDALGRRLLQPDRLKALLANLLDDSPAAVRDRQAHLKAFRTERTRVDRAVRICSMISGKESLPLAMQILPRALPRSAIVALISSPRLF